MVLPDREEQPRFRFPGFCQDVDSVCPNGPQAHACRERLAITFAQSPSASRSTRKSFASWDRMANCCARSSPLQAQKWRVVTCQVLYRNGAPRSTKMSNIASAQRYDAGPTTRGTPRTRDRRRFCACLVSESFPISRATRYSRIAKLLNIAGAMSVVGGKTEELCSI